MSAAPRALRSSRSIRAVALGTAIVAAFVAALAGLRASAEGDRRNGITIAYFDGSYARDFHVHARLALPAATANRDWYTDWIMLVARREDDLGQPFVQVGLMRWKRHNFRLSSFIAYGRDAATMTYEDIALVGEGTHVVELIGRGDVVEASVDGAVVRRIPRARLFAPDDVAYVQVAAEVFAPGDVATGRIGELRVASSGGALEPATPRCFREDRGLRLAWDGGWLHASGRFDLDAPSSFTGCDDFRYGDDPPDTATSRRSARSLP